MIHRTNMAEREAESWRPISFSSTRTGIQPLLFFARRILDLQTSSIWADASEELPHVRGTAVDAGCGAQPFRALFPRDVRYIGIDSSAAEAHFGYAVPDTIYYEGAAWPLANESAEFVLCTETLEHVLDTRAFLREAARCLVPGGRILLTVPFSARWHYIPFDYWRFTPSSLAHLLAETGFEDVRVYARGNEVTVACYKLMALILPLLAPQGKNAVMGVILRFFGILLLPVFAILAAIGNISLHGKGGDDCLGYTVKAQRAGRI